ncbi:MAG: YmaF family protein [Clostridiaceae bacterium]
MSERDLNYNAKCYRPDPNDSQTHTHEFLGSTRLAEQGEDRHNHRFAGVTSEVIPMGNSHVHAILVNTDFFDHHHEIGVTTGLAIDVGNGKHVHLATGVTTLVDGHNHSFIFTTLIQSPLT